MISHLTRFSITALALVGFAGSAQAALQYAELGLGGLGEPECDTMGCEGSTLFLSVEEVAPDSWVITYTIDTDGYTGDQLGFNQIGFKVLKDVDWTTASVTTDFPLPAPDPDNTSGWVMVYESPVSSNSLCEHQHGDPDRACTAGFVDIKDPGGIYTWVFTVDGGTLMDTSEWHFGGQYANDYYEAEGKIISAGGAPVPEPTAAVLFGLGALLVARSARRH
jgi:hypothetical protein